MIRFCKSCGTLYDDKAGGCPKCEAVRLPEEEEGDALNREMSGEELKKARRNSWIGILVGVPLFIGGIYLIFFIIKLLGT
jgi:hypothetical protein